MKKKANYKAIVITVIGLVAFGFGFSSLFIGSGPSEKEKHEMMKTGTRTTATLLSAERTGTIVNNIHQYEFHFGGVPFRGKRWRFPKEN